MKDFSQLKKNLKKDFAHSKPIKITLWEDLVKLFITQAICDAGFEYKLDQQVWKADYNQIEQQFFSPTSELYCNQPEFVILFQSTQHQLVKLLHVKSKVRRRLER